jgi:hypothetical protein
LIQTITFAENSQVMQNLLGALHAPGFLLASALLLTMFERTGWPMRIALPGAALVSLGLAIISEAAQYFSARDAEWQDLAYDLLGIAAGLVLAVVSLRSFRVRLGQAWLFSMVSVGIILAIVALPPSIMNLGWLAARLMAFPVIADFEQAWQTEFILPIGEERIDVVDSDQASPATRSLRVTLTDSRYSGFAIQPHANWSGYYAISFIAWSSSQGDQQVSIRIHDANHNQRHDDRFSKNFVLGDNPRRYVIKLSTVQLTASGRMLDLQRITGVAFYKTRPQTGEQLFFDDIRLE